MLQSSDRVFVPTKPAQPKSSAGKIYYYRQIHIGESPTPEIARRIEKSQRDILRELYRRDAKYIMPEAFDEETAQPENISGFKRWIKRSGYIAPSRAEKDGFCVEPHSDRYKKRLVYDGAARVYRNISKSETHILPLENAAAHASAHKAGVQYKKLWDECEKTSKVLRELRSLDRDYARRLSGMQEGAEKRNLQAFKSENRERIAEVRRKRNSLVETRDAQYTEYQRLARNTREEFMVRNILQAHEAHPNEGLHVILGAGHQLPEKIRAADPNINVVDMFPDALQSFISGLDLQ